MTAHCLHDDLISCSDATESTQPPSTAVASALLLLLYKRNLGGAIINNGRIMTIIMSLNLFMTVQDTRLCLCLGMWEYYSVQYVNFPLIIIIIS